MQLVLENANMPSTYKQRYEQNPKFLFIIIRLSPRFNLDRFCQYVFQLLCTSFLIKSYLFTSAFNMSDLEMNLLKSEFGILNDLASLLYLPLVSGDNNFICSSSAEINFIFRSSDDMPLKWPFSIVNPAV
jgi:hypothetical protein